MKIRFVNVKVYTIRNRTELENVTPSASHSYCFYDPAKVSHSELKAKLESSRFKVNIIKIRMFFIIKTEPWEFNHFIFFCSPDFFYSLKRNCLSCKCHCKVITNIRMKSLRFLERDCLMITLRSFILLMS